MLGKANSRRSSRYFAKHFLDELHNEFVSILHVENLVPARSGSTTLEQVLFLLDQLSALSVGTTIKNYMNVGSLRGVKKDRPLTLLEKVEAVKMLLAEQGLQGQPFFIVGHSLLADTDAADWHIHWCASRVRDGRAICDRGNWYQVINAVKKIEDRFGLTKTEKKRNFKNLSGYSIKPYEIQNGYHAGIDPRFLCGEISFWTQVDKTGAEFQKSIDFKGWILAEGRSLDKDGAKSLFIVDRAGGKHQLQARINNKNNFEYLAYVSTIDRSKLPSIADAVSQQRIRMKLPDEEWLKVIWGSGLPLDEIVRMSSLKNIDYNRGAKPNIYFAVQGQKWLSLQKLTGLPDADFKNRIAGFERFALPRIYDTQRRYVERDLAAGSPAYRMMLAYRNRQQQAAAPKGTVHSPAAQAAHRGAVVQNNRKKAYSAASPPSTSQRLASGRSLPPTREIEHGSGVGETLRLRLDRINDEFRLECKGASDAYLRVSRNIRSTDAECAAALDVFEIATAAARYRADQASATVKENAAFDEAIYKRAVKKRAMTERFIRMDMMHRQSEFLKVAISEANALASVSLSNSTSDPGGPPRSPGSNGLRV